MEEKFKQTNLFFDDIEISDAGEVEGEESRYTNKVQIPQYEPKEYCPSISEMMDTTKYIDLIKEINASNVSDEDKQFLRLAAARHIVFSYSKIADYYAHASKEMQELMEHSALVVIDINDALAQGFAKLDYRLVEIAKESKEANTEEEK